MSDVLSYAAAPGIYLAALAAANANLEARAKPLLDAREDIAFHADALCGIRLDDGNSADCLLRDARCAMSDALRPLDEALAELRCRIAGDHRLWDGIDPADVPLDALPLMIRHHRDALRRAA